MPSNFEKCKEMRKLLGTIVLVFCMVLPSSAKKIHMNGFWNTKKRSLENTLPIRAFIDESVKELSLEFTTDLGILYVTVSDSNGNIITEVINAASDIPVDISLSKALEGTFILSITDNNNEIWGDFSLTK